MQYFVPFTIPFVVGTAVLFAAVGFKWILWLVRLPRVDRVKIRRGIFTRNTLVAVWEVVRESLLHVRIFRHNPLLGYMHASLAFGWFLLIAVGWIETAVYLGFDLVPLQGHVFFKYFAPHLNLETHYPLFDHLMDALLLVVLSGVALAWFKRIRSKTMGMRRTTKHVLFDRVALTALWFVFPLRLVAESVTVAVHGGGGFLTGTLGEAIVRYVPYDIIEVLYTHSWWLYSSALGIFFVAMPFSRYMHILTEIPLIFLRRWSLRPTKERKSFDNFEVEACSRCGICIDPCQLQMQLGINDVQSVYFLRDRRKNRLQQKIANNCLMCGRCEQICPVGINLNTLRLNSRTSMRNIPNESRYKYLKNLDRSSGEGRVGYFAGCMTLLTPNTLSAMQHIFDAAREDVWWADKNGGVCCGRPLKLSGESDSAQKMIDYNKSLFYKHNITTLVTSCPICLRIFNEEYKLDGIEVLHHSEYILRLIEQGRLHVNYSTEHTFTYHDPCELGRGSGIYNEPRAVIEAIGTLLEPTHTRKNALCCGSSLANTAINDSQQLTIARNVAEDLDNTGAETIVTACPLCKKAIARGATHQVKDLSEIVAANIL